MTKVERLRAQARALAIEAEALRRQADKVWLAGSKGYGKLYKAARAKDAEVDAVCKDIVAARR